MSNKEILDLDLTFEVSYSDMFGKNHTTELVTNGANIQVTKSNLEEYIDKYTGFFMKDGIAKQVDAFITGFNNVIEAMLCRCFCQKRFSYYCVVTMIIE